METRDSFRKQSGPPFYRKPAAVAWTVILAMALMLVFYLIEMI